MKITKLIIPLLGLAQINNANKQELLQIEKEKNVDVPCQILEVENKPDYSQQIIEFEPSSVQEEIFQDGNDELKIKGWKRTLYSPYHEDLSKDGHCYGGYWGTYPQTSFRILGGTYFCTNPDPYWNNDKWAPEKNEEFHNDILLLDWKLKKIQSVEINIIYREWWKSDTYIINSYTINYANGVKETKFLADGKEKNK